MTARHTVPTRLERTMLYVPATRLEVIAKAAASIADAVCIDLEDAVAVDDKPAARANVVRALREFDFGRKVRAFRINGLDTPFAYRDLIEVVEEAGDRLDLVMLPKAGGPQDVMFVDTLLTQIEVHRGFARPIGIEAQIESAKGFLWVREIAEASPRLEALVFGPGDYSASMQMPSANIGEFDANDELYPGHRWHAAMHAVVAAARAKGLRCMDGPYAGFSDLAGLERASRIARVMGFDGKQCIHPNQLATVNAVFAPSAEDVERARGVVDAYEAAVRQGRGAVTYQGKMIDAANIRMARAVLEKSALIDQRAG